MEHCSASAILYLSHQLHDVYIMISNKAGPLSFSLPMIIYLYYFIYRQKKYLESRWLKYSKAEDGLYPTAGDSPPPTYVSLSALEYQ